MEAFLQKQMRAQRRHIPQAAPRTEAMLYSACAAEATPTAGPSLQMVRHNAAKCWEGYERVPGTKPGADGSCRKKGSGHSDASKKKKKKKRKKDGGSSSSSSSSESDGEGGRRKKQKKAKE